MATATAIKYEDLCPGDRIRVTRRIKIGLKFWDSPVSGTVERIERRRNGLHVERNYDDKAFQDVIILQKDGTLSEETTVVMDEYTFIDRI